MLKRTGIRSFFSLVAIFLAAAAAMAQSPAPATAKGLNDLKFPDIEGWIQGDKVETGIPGAGYAVNYEMRDQKYRATVYVYDREYTDIGTDLGGRVKAEFDETRASFETMVEMGMYSSAKELANKTTTLGEGGKVKALSADFLLVARGRELSSGLFLFPYKKNFIKIRMSGPSSEAASAKAGLQKFYAELDTFFSK